MIKPLRTHLSRRESEIMDIVYRLGEASVADVESLMSDSPGYDSVRVTLGILVKKKHVKYRRDGRRYIYAPTLSREKATRFAMRNLLQTFFDGSVEKAVAKGMNASQILTLLSENSRVGIPQNVIYSIKEWAEKVKFVQVRPATLLRGRNKEVVDRILQSENMKDIIIERLSPTVLMISTDANPTRLRKTLEKLGIFLEGHEKRGVTEEDADKEEE